MAICTDKIVFYSVPKSGTVFAREAMRKAGIKYGRCRELPVNHYLKRAHACPAVIVPEDKEGRFSFCFVRHPIQWYQSFWCFRERSKTVDLRFPADRCWDNVFERFVVNVLERYPNGFVTELYQQYVGEDADQMDFIGRQENLVDDLIQALYLAGEEFDEEIIRNHRKMNVAASSRKFGSLAVMSRRTRNWILDNEKWVVEMFYEG